MSAFLNPILVSVALMIALCLLRANVFLSIVIASMVCGLLGGGTPAEVFAVFVEGASANSSLILSMLLFGIVVEGIRRSGLGEALAPRLSALAGERKWLMLLFLFLFGMLAESVFMLGPTAVPLVVPPLLAYANAHRIDRRCIAAVVIGGLQLGYSCVPLGFGLAFHQIVASAVTEGGLPAATGDVWRAVLPFALALVLGAVLALVLYRAPRSYAAAKPADEAETLPPLERKHWATIVTAVVMIGVQLLTSSLPLGAAVGISLLLLLQVIPWREFDKACTEGLLSFGMIAFILMAAAGFAAVFRVYGQIDALVDATTGLLGGNRVPGALCMLLLGFVITMGIGSGFAAAPIVATILVPMCAQLGLGSDAAVLLVAAAAALGDGVTPASSQTLLPTAALNIDGAHDHIRDTCVPVFLCYGLPSAVAVVLAVIL